MVLVVGPGAVGSLLAARWAMAGETVLLLGRDAACESRLMRRGIELKGLDGRKRLVRRGILGARGRPRAACEAVFFCVKSRDTAAAARSARPWIGPETAVVSLQNGLGHETLLRRAFGAQRVVIGSCYFAADRTPSGGVSHTGGDRILLSAGRESAASRAARRRGMRRMVPRCLAPCHTARRLLRSGGWKVGTAASEDRMLWTKLCFNAATNPLGALCAVPNGALSEDRALREIMLKALDEAVAAARRAGHRPLYRDMAGLLLRSCRNAPLQRNSMLQDLQARRGTEIKAIAGPLLAAARRTGVQAPILSRLSSVMRKLEKLR